ncbi:ribosomal small subunit pseudouridine synthase A [Ferrimonas sediminum]|uniref:Pseudouridine synthase n=1 Tax=Ferrimonas sediminum TaxID=718193 RepID=A0A1G8WVI3_9GAMM|nr:16S rRNA pseudouridine(516) synthase [Ferrimonas sediminum]SDJ82211.1 ribosomal small subunit pseudouridine synthase A [Ferrimonas sediminum]
MRLDRFISKTTRESNRQIRIWIQDGQVWVDGQPCLDGTRRVTEFSQIRCNGIDLPCKRAQYWLMNKAAGVLSATRDPEHRTVIEELAAQQPELVLNEIHIAGRLDRASTGLLILTNDGNWSKRLTRPEIKIPKTYLVTTANPINPDTGARFAEGIHFPYEGITTSPAQLTQLSPHQARLTIYEGKYHQIKRMFGVFRNPVVALHRERMGEIVLEPELAPGGCRPLSRQEIDWL